MLVGTLINAATIVIASIAGILVGSRMKDEVRKALMNVLGLPVLLIGISMGLKTENVLIPTLSIVAGTIAGELIGIERWLENFGVRVERRFGRGKFSEGFVGATLLYCVGPMAILGPIQEGLTGDISVLLAKSMLDGVASIALASALGIGVAFSSVSVLLYQGFFAVLASELSRVVTESMINELTATGGLLIMGIGINLLELKKLRVGNMLPALVIAPLIVYFV
ncbi:MULTISPECIES: DUF554 domain-containing protein [unclassified Archaeoglobus]|jgi:hypothetical protein|uniref:DUF554 domain-containing protein n=1 Tax=unclassified Archaeoglobus TaxID=2643606 RepID=UPI0025B8409B|nr:MULTISPECIES: DUF554 domain-containing protein [unclassified Archaeoglobus]